MTVDPQAATNCPTITRTPPTTFKLRATRTEVAHTRSHLTEMLAGLVPAKHLDDLHLAASELVTNALRAALDYAVLRGWNWHWQDEPIHLGVTSTCNWSRLDVHDPDPVVPDPGTRGLLAESGRGLLIVRNLAACEPWWDRDATGKTVHAVIAMPQIKLTETDLKLARQ